MFRFELKRSEWGRGERVWIETENRIPVNQSRLMREDGLKCCLGFRCLAAGYSSDDISLIGYTFVLQQQYRLPAWLRDRYDADMNLAIGVNDDRYMDDEEREDRLREIFARHNEEIVFVD